MRQDNMEDSSNRGDLQGNVVRHSALHLSRSMKSTLSGRSTPRKSPSLRRLHSSRTPRREARARTESSVFVKGNRVLLWLFLITFWAYLGFYIQSRWAHSDDNTILTFSGYESKAVSDSLAVTNGSSPHSGNIVDSHVDDGSSEILIEENQKSSVVNMLEPYQAKKRNRASSHKNPAPKNSRRYGMVHSQKGTTMLVKSTGADQNNFVQEDLLIKNASYGLIVGPFDKTEDRILSRSPAERTGSCDRNRDLAHVVWSKTFVLILHELSVTGAPLTIMELATELLSCGASVSAVVLSKKGGLMSELSRRGIKVMLDKTEQSYKIAMTADLIIAGSAVCESWIEQYLLHFPSGGNHIIWWIMENRREYFDRSKSMLGRVKLLIFLSDSQLKKWLAWCEEEHIILKSQPKLVPLSVNDELAFVAGIPCSLNTPSFTVENMEKKRLLLRAAIREEMGLSENDMLVMSLSSINPAKGQLLLLQSAVLTIQGLNRNISRIGLDTSQKQQHSRIWFKGIMQSRKLMDEYHQVDGSNFEFNYSTIDSVPSDLSRRHLTDAMLYSGDKTKKTLSHTHKGQEHFLKVLIGSMGSKSNKVHYMKEIFHFLSEHPDISKLLLWTPSTTRVAALYTAADVYVINAQGVGETFGRVTVEAMAFGLPVLGTDAGGTKEIVDHRVTGLLHPVGHQGTLVLAHHLQLLQLHTSARQQMGLKGKEKVLKKFLKRHMYHRLANILKPCLRP